MQVQSTEEEQLRLVCAETNAAAPSEKREVTTSQFSEETEHRVQTFVFGISNFKHRVQTSQLNTKLQFYHAYQIKVPSNSKTSSI